VKRILVAGIGNVFLGDDGFGVEVVRRLHGVEVPARVDVVDYGIRGVHLAYDLLNGCHDLVVLVDALPLDEPAGTLAVVEVDLSDPQWTLGSTEALDEGVPGAHGMDPETTLRLVATLGAPVHRALVVGCQPAAVAEGMELSEPVRQCIEPAVRMVTEIVRDESGRLDRLENGACSHA
jgi:hydrogenase maturation protease